MRPIPAEMTREASFSKAVDPVLVVRLMLFSAGEVVSAGFSAVVLVKDAGIVVVLSAVVIVEVGGALL